MPKCSDCCELRHELSDFKLVVTEYFETLLQVLRKQDGHILTLPQQIIRNLGLHSVLPTGDQPSLEQVRFRDGTETEPIYSELSKYPHDEHDNSVVDCYVDELESAESHCLPSSSCELNQDTDSNEFRAAPVINSDMKFEAEEHVDQNVKNPNCGLSNECPPDIESNGEVWVEFGAGDDCGSEMTVSGIAMNDTQDNITSQQIEPIDDQCDTDESICEMRLLLGKFSSSSVEGNNRTDNGKINDQKVIQCNICQRMFKGINRRTSVFHHIRNIHFGRKFQCTICNHVLKHRIQKHIKSAHPYVRNCQPYIRLIYEPPEN